jgi:hypothetical protein
MLLHIAVTALACASILLSGCVVEIPLRIIAGAIDASKADEARLSEPSIDNASRRHIGTIKAGDVLPAGELYLVEQNEIPGTANNERVRQFVITQSFWPWNRQGAHRAWASTDCGSKILSITNSYETNAQGHAIAGNQNYSPHLVVKSAREPWISAIRAICETSS